MTEKSKIYALTASKGLSYLLPKTAQSHLLSVQKLLPPAARAIYNEFYRDIMCTKVCAAESALAMEEFVRRFPEVRGLHDQFARVMNGEIGGHVFEGFEPVLFPVLGVEMKGLDEEDVQVQRKKGRKGKTAQMATPPPSNAAVSGVMSSSSSSVTAHDNGNEPPPTEAPASRPASPTTTSPLTPTYTADHITTPSTPPPPSKADPNHFSQTPSPLPFSPSTSGESYSDSDWETIASQLSTLTAITATTTTTTTTTPFSASTGQTHGEILMNTTALVGGSVVIDSSEVSGGKELSGGEEVSGVKGLSDGKDVSEHNNVSESRQVSQAKEAARHAVFEDSMVADERKTAAFEVGVEAEVQEEVEVELEERLRADEVSWEEGWTAIEEFGW